MTYDEHEFTQAELVFEALRSGLMVLDRRFWVDGACLQLLRSISELGSVNSLLKYVYDEHDCF